MAQYILIDNPSGNIWWQGFRADPITACEAADAEIAPGDSFEYEETYELMGNEAGYHVYQVPPDFSEVEDGCSESEIQAVMQHERVAIVRCTRID